MTSDVVAEQVANAFADAVTLAASRQRRWRCAVPGGSVATIVFPRLALRALPWAILDVFLADERLVAPDHPDSNARALREHWLNRLDGEAPTFHPIPTDAHGAEDAAHRASVQLCQTAGTPPRLDVVMLGVGSDGHVASLFPGRRDWRASDAWVLAVHDAPKPPPERVSLGLATLSIAHEIWFVAFGAEKAAAISEARTRPDSPLPVAVVARSGPRVRWFLDRAASGG